MVSTRPPPSSAPIRTNAPTTNSLFSSQLIPSSSQRLLEIQEALDELPRTQAPPGTKRHVASQERLENIKAAFKSVAIPTVAASSPLVGDCAQNNKALTSGTKRLSSSCPPEKPPASKRRQLEASGDRLNELIELDDDLGLEGSDAVADSLFGIDEPLSDIALSQFYEKRGYLESKTFDVTLESWKAQSQTSEKRPKGHYVRQFFALYPRFSHDSSKSATEEYHRMIASFALEEIPEQLTKSRQLFDYALMRDDLEEDRKEVPIKDEDTKDIVVKEETKVIVKQETNYLRKFFSQHPDFDYNPSNAATDEFMRLSQSLNWRKQDVKREKKNLNDAMVHQFNSTYGTNANDAEPWRMMCEDLDIKPIPDTLEEVREAILSTHVNIVDLLRARSGPGPVQIKVFASEVDLSRYTQISRKYFPRSNIHAGDILELLLRHIHRPSVDKLSRGGARTTNCHN